MPAVFWLSFPRLLEFLTRTKAMWWLRIFITYRPYKKQKAIIVILDYLLKRQLFKKSLHEKMKTFYILILSLLTPYSLSYTVKIWNKTNIYVHVFYS